MNKSKKHKVLKEYNKGKMVELRNHHTVANLPTNTKIYNVTSLLNLDNYVFDENNKLVGDKYLIQAKQSRSFKEAKKSLPKAKFVRKSAPIPIKINNVYRPTELEYNHGITDYHTYIQSEAWWKRRTKYFETHQKACNKCNKTNIIVLHHIKYQKSDFGKEKDKDLVALCRECHNDFHSKYGVHTDMHKMHKKWMKELTNQPNIV